MPNTATLKPLGPHPAAAAADATPLFSFAMLSHAGCVRHTNQDACAALPEHSAFVVCDGVGGAAGGEIASHLAVEAFLNTLSQSSPNATRRKARSTPAAAPAEAKAVESKEAAGPGDAHHPHARLREAVLTANHAVFQRAQKSRALRGMATTLVAVLLDHAAASPAAAAQPDNAAAPAQTPAQTPAQNGAAGHGAAGHSAHNGHAPAVAEEVHTLWLAHVGDSRCYRLRRRIGSIEGAEGVPAAFVQLTTDHSLVEEQIRAGVLSRAEAEHSPVRNVITRAVGAAPAVEPEIAAHAIQPGDLYLLASDGLTRELDDAAIARILTAAAAPERTDSSLEAAAHALGTSQQTSQAALESAARTLIDAANAHGGHDNITVLLIACT